MGSLLEVVQDPQKRPAVVADCVALIEAEVADTSGLGGMAAKVAFAAVKGVNPGMVPQAVNRLLDDFARQVDPFWQECRRSGEAPRAYFGARRSEVANALLAVSDARARRSRNTVLVKAYESLRTRAVEHIGRAMPRFADLLERHAG